MYVYHTSFCYFVTFQTCIVNVSNKNQFNNLDEICWNLWSDAGVRPRRQAAKSKTQYIYIISKYTHLLSNIKFPSYISSLHIWMPQMLERERKKKNKRRHFLISLLGSFYETRTRWKLPRRDPCFPLVTRRSFNLAFPICFWCNNAVFNLGIFYLFLGEKYCWFSRISKNA